MHARKATIAFSNRHASGRWLTAAVIALIAVMLAACGGGLPFGKEEGVPGPKGKSVPPVALLAVEGLPADRVAIFTEALTAAGGGRDIAIVEGLFDDGTLALRGRFQAAPQSDATRVSYAWALTDKAGTALKSFAGEEAAPAPAGADPWSGVTPAVLQRIADATARSLAAALAELGYATETGAIHPPAAAWRLATALDGRLIDLETWHGPNTAPPPDPPATASVSEPEPVAPPADPAPAPKAKARGPAIKAVAVVAVTGAPGRGNAELTEAMRAVLTSAGWPVVSAPRADALTVAGTVALAKPKGATQTATLAWAVTMPDGRAVGTVRQANEIPAGAVDQGFGANARAAAEAAATGIFDLVNKLR